ncbi:MAG: MurR/RpiR family transcriptional regulator [Pseudomonadota bacterium]|nr:MurR/RpiR family transcriptional regulator [Pseudomonadota bacterium]
MTQTVVDQLRESLGSFPVTERRVAHRLLAEYPMAGLQSATDLARAVGVSTPTVLRMVARLGFESYVDFQRRLRDELTAQLSSPLQKPVALRSPGKKAQVHAHIALGEAVARNVEETFANLSAQEVEQVVRLLGDRKNRVHMIGGRFTDALARYLSVQMCIIRPGVRHLQDQEANWQDQLLDMDHRDVLLIFDIRRYQASLQRLAELAAAKQVRVLLITDQWLSPIAKVAKHVLPARVVVPSVWDSSAALMAICEALLAAVTRDNWDYAQKRIRDLERLRAGAKS